MLAVASTLVGLRELQLKRWAFLFKIERRDGVSLYLGSHDHQVVYQGNTYTPVGSADVSARRRESALRDHDVEFRGAISSSAITHDDMRAGRYRDAKITEYLVDWRYPFAGAFSTTIGWIQKTTFDGELWVADVQGLGRFLKHRVGTLFNRTCDADLFDARCGVVEASFTVTGVSPSGMVDGQKRRIIRANPATLSGSFADNWFRHGKVTFTAGANLGLSREVQLYTQATREIQCQLEFPFDIATTDVFSITAGCDHRPSTCLNKFSNLINFRGFPFVPGTDQVLQITPR